MKNILKTTIFGLYLLGSLGLPQVAQATIFINSISVFDFENNTAKLKWRTDVATRGIVYYGENANDLNHSNTSSDDYKNYHEVSLNNIKEDVTYYYQIVVFARDGQASETYVQNFKVDDMPDTRKPKFDKQEIIQSTGDAVALYWTTNEKTRATIYYGFETTAMNKTANYGGFDTEHNLFIYNLVPGSKYYLRIVAEDKDKNKTNSKTFIFNTSSTAHSRVLEIKNIKPNGFDKERIFTDTAVITWQTNLIAKSYLVYGTDQKSLNQKIEVHKNDRSTDHRAVLSNLKPNTTYYYKIKVYDSLYGKGTESATMSFMTLPEQRGYILGVKIINENIDTDYDGLSDAQEYTYQTNPFKSDTDGDGYKDGIEVKNGYDPLGPGRLPQIAGIKIYNQSEKSQELRTALEKKIGKFSISASNWEKLVNAYVNNGYPVEAIAQAIKWGGKTVHPTIPWSSWKNSNDYKNYINK